jgi:hypothetical protein
MVRGEPRDRERGLDRILQGRLEATHRHVVAVGRRGTLLWLDRRDPQTDRRRTLHQPVHAASAGVGVERREHRAREGAQTGWSHASGRARGVQRAKADPRAVFLRAAQANSIGTLARGDVARQQGRLRILQRPAARSAPACGLLRDERQAGRDAATSIGEPHDDVRNRTTTLSPGTVRPPSTVARPEPLSPIPSNLISQVPTQSPSRSPGWSRSSTCPIPTLGSKPTVR